MTRSCCFPPVFLCANPWYLIPSQRSSRFFNLLWFEKRGLRRSHANLTKTHSRKPPLFGFSALLCFLLFLKCLSWEVSGAAGENKSASRKLYLSKENSSGVASFWGWPNRISSLHPAHQAGPVRFKWALRSIPIINAVIIDVFRTNTASYLHRPLSRVYTSLVLFDTVQIVISKNTLKPWHIPLLHIHLRAVDLAFNLLNK